MMMSLADAVGAYGRVGLRAIGLVEALDATRELFGERFGSAS
jgi:hypothetical protein